MTARLLATFVFFFLSNTVLAEKVLLKNPDWLSSQEKRSLLSFISECALKKDQILVSDNKSPEFEFHGKLGVAARWDGFPGSLTESQQRWVSACVLSRVNYFGTPVTFNLRTDKKSGLYTPVTQSELDEFTYFEGGFFGNIFEQPQKKYVCQGSISKKILVQKSRLCSIPTLDGDSSISSCGFTIVGDCNNPAVFHRNNTQYREVFQVWLKPN